MMPAGGIVSHCGTPAGDPTASPGSIIMGVDPGMTRTGYGLLEVQAHRLRFIDGGIISTSPRQPLERRLEKVFRNVRETIERYSPHVLVIEELYSHYKHPETVIMMGHVRGVICCAAGLAGLPVIGYSATEVKKMITGSGRASKVQIQRAACHELGLETVLKPADLTDALALGICHARCGRMWGRDGGAGRRRDLQKRRYREAKVGQETSSLPEGAR
jgi:crossover junction endodeoxyribonuclease RuvC